MAYPWLSPLLAALATAVLAVIVNRRGQRSELRDVFTFLASMLVFWNLNFFVLYSVPDHNLVLGLTRVFRTSAIFMMPAILHLVVALKSRSRPVWRWALWMDYGLAVPLAAANAFDLLISDVRRVPWGYSSVGTSFYTFYVIFAVLNTCAALALVVYDYRTATAPGTRLQLKFWLIGALIALPLGQTNLLPAYGIPVYPLGHLGIVAWVGIVAYAIVRHRLMDIDLVLTKGMAYAAVALVLIAPAFATTLWLQRVFFGHIHQDFSFAVLIMFILVGALFPILRSGAESRIRRSLFSEKHQDRKALVEFTRSIVRILDRERLAAELTGVLNKTLRPDRVAIALFDDAKQLFRVRYTTGAPALEPEFAAGHELINCLTRRQQTVLRNELEDSSDPIERTAAAESCRRNGWEVCMPLMLGGKLMGFIGLGRKPNLDAYYVQDLELLETLAAEASVALENARLYEELKKSQDIIRRADRLSALGTLAAGIAHEVRNPLVSIQTFFQLAPQRLHDEEFFTTFLGMTAGEVKRISDLITELLSFARSSTPSLGAVNLNELVDRVATLLEPEARKHKLTLTRALSPNVPLVNADGDQIKQVLINLVLNAIQATGPGGVISVTTRSVDHRKGAFGQLEIHDTGVGIPQEQLEHIFDPFFTTKDKGTGLGLAIAHQIVTEHGGTITVDSRKGHGSSFCVNLPPYDAASRSTPPEAQTAMEAFPLRYARARKVASS